MHPRVRHAGRASYQATVNKKGRATEVRGKGLPSESGYQIRKINRGQRLDTPVWCESRWEYCGSVEERITDSTSVRDMTA